jgi:hypothetical protein
VRNPLEDHLPDVEAKADAEYIIDAKFAGFVPTANWLSTTKIIKA